MVNVVGSELGRMASSGLGDVMTVFGTCPTYSRDTMRGLCGNVMYGVAMVK